MVQFAYSQTYLFKFHKLTNQLDKAFDTVLRQRVGFGLAQFTLLLTVMENEPINQSQVSSLLGVSHAATSRRVEIAVNNSWIIVSSNNSDRRDRMLQLTPKGIKAAKSGLFAVESFANKLFEHHNRSTSLMNHIDHLLDQTNVAQKPLTREPGQSIKLDKRGAKYEFSRRN